MNYASEVTLLPCLVNEKRLWEPTIRADHASFNCIIEKRVCWTGDSPVPRYKSPIRPCDVRSQVTIRRVCVCVRPGCGTFACPPSVYRASWFWRVTCWKQQQIRRQVDGVPVLCLSVHVDKDGGGGNGSHGGALVERQVCGDQIRTQVWHKHSWGEINQYDQCSSVLFYWAHRIIYRAILIPPFEL